MNKIVSRRHFLTASCFDIVYLWEDELSRALGIDIVDDERLTSKALSRMAKSRFWRMAALLFPSLANRLSFTSNALAFELDVWRDPGFNRPDIIPCIIDFQERNWLHLCCFALAFRKCKVVLVSSKEACEFLKRRGVSLPVRHWALSIPDSLVSEERLRSGKRYDMAMMGRVNPVLDGYVRRYARTHPDFVYLSKAVKDGRVAYESSKGEFVGTADAYTDYLRIMGMAKIGVYCTPGMDGARSDARGFNQVTPRFLEYLSSGCHVIARYPNNADVSYYDLPSICPSIESYDQFEREVDRMRRVPIDVERYLKYLARHVTSTRAAELKAIMQEEIL